MRETQLAAHGNSWRDRAALRTFRSTYGDGRAAEILEDAAAADRAFLEVIECAPLPLGGKGRARYARLVEISERLRLVAFRSPLFRAKLAAASEFRATLLTALPRVPDPRSRWPTKAEIARLHKEATREEREWAKLDARLGRAAARPTAEVDEDRATPKPRARSRSTSGAVEAVQVARRQLRKLERDHDPFAVRIEALEGRKRRQRDDEPTPGFERCAIALAARDLGISPEAMKSRRRREGADKQQAR